MPEESLVIIPEDDLEPEDEVIIIGPEDLADDESIIIIAEDDLEPEDEIIRIGPEDLVEGAAIWISEEDIAEEDLRALFRREPMRQFVAFVSAGLPFVFLRAHEELMDSDKQKQIKEAIEQVPDQALRKHLLSRLRAIERFQST